MTLTQLIERAREIILERPELANKEVYCIGGDELLGPVEKMTVEETHSDDYHYFYGGRNGTPKSDYVRIG